MATILRRRGGSTARGATAGNLGALEEEEERGRDLGHGEGAGGGRWFGQQSGTTHPATAQGLPHCTFGPFFGDFQHSGNLLITNFGTHNNNHGKDNIQFSF